MYEVSFGAIVCDLDRSIQVTGFQWLYLQVVTIDDELEVIYEVSFGAIVFDLERH